MEPPENSSLEVYAWNLIKALGWTVALIPPAWIIYRCLKSYYLPSKEKERERLVRASQTLYDSMHKLELSTNKASHILHQHLNMGPPRVEVNDTLSIKENLDHLVFALQEIHSTTENMDRHIRKNLAQTQYDKLMVNRSSLEEKRTIISNFQAATMGIFGSVSGPLVSVLLKRSNIPNVLERALRQIESSPVLALHVQDLLLSSDDIAKAIYDERATQPHLTWYQLITRVVFGDKRPPRVAAGHVKRVAEVLRPLSEDIQFLINEVEIYISLITVRHI